MQRQVEGYTLRQTLGSGLQGKVKLAIHEGSGKCVALKVIDKEKLGQRELMNLYKEVEAMRRLSHPHVVKLLAVHNDAMYPKKSGAAKPAILIALELAKGGELFDFMMYTGCFPENIARAFFQQLVLGLEECHSNGIYHRDIKPENLLLDENFGLKIADFGLSALHETPEGTLTQLYTQCGTRGYMCPELLSGQPYDGAAADIWSAGVVLFIMLAGFPPFQIAQKQDWWFRAISIKQYDAFWAAHSRSVTFSAGAMSLLSQIFVAEPSERMKLSDIKAHPWFLQDTVAPEMLQSELAMRKMQVEKQKQHQRMLKKQQANPANGDSMEFNPFEQNIMRSVAPDGKSAQSKKKKKPSTIKCSFPIYQRADSKPSFARYTCFYSQFCPKELCGRIEQAFSAMSANYTVNEEKGKLKATLGSPAGKIDLVAQIYACPESNSLYATEIRRRNGGLLKFQEAYKVLCTHLSDVICDPPSANEDAVSSALTELELADTPQII